MVVHLEELSSVGSTIDTKSEWSFTKSHIIEAFDVKIGFIINQVVNMVVLCLLLINLRLAGNILEFLSFSIVLLDLPRLLFSFLLLGVLFTFLQIARFLSAPLLLPKFDFIGCFCQRMELFNSKNIKLAKFFVFNLLKYQLILNGGDDCVQAIVLVMVDVDAQVVWIWRSSSSEH